MAVPPRLLVLCLAVPCLFAQSPGVREIRAASELSITAIERAAAAFSKSQDCFSCHHTSLPLLTFRAARERGIAVNETTAHEIAANGLAHSPDLRSVDRAVQENMIIDPAPGEGWAILAADAAGVPKTIATAIYARRIANWQRADGHFPTGDARPPQSSSLFTATAIASRVIRDHLPDQLAAEKADRLEHARAWLLAAVPRSTEDYTFRLFGLAWANAEKMERARATSELAALQRPDGGWGQLPHLAPDAYSTGEALVALHEAGGLDMADPRLRKGLAFLLSTRDSEGVWHVKTRMTSPAAVSPPYFETGFSYGHDQFISLAGTCWATMALLEALPKTAAPAAPIMLAGFDPTMAPWMSTAVFGTLTELKSLLDGGLDPNSKTSDGTTLLMMTAHDAAKVRLLLERGTDAAAKAKSGFTALMVAATYQGTVESSRLLLAHGAQAQPGTGVLYNASPLVLAALTGDVDNINLLLSKGADPNRRMNLLGMFPASPLFAATNFADPEVLAALIKGGARLDERDPDQMTALHWAVLSNRVAGVKALIASGADVNAVDKFGYTPLLYAATVDFGNADTVKPLLNAGADRSIHSKDGKTAATQASTVPHLRAALEK